MLDTAKCKKTNDFKQPKTYQKTDCNKTTENKNM